MKEGGHELVVVEGAVEGQGKAVRQGGVADVEALLADGSEDVVRGIAVVGAGDLVVDGVGVEEGDGEAPGGEIHGQVDGGDDVALQRISDEDGMRLLAVIIAGVSHLFVISLHFLSRRKWGERIKR